MEALELVAHPPKREFKVTLWYNQTLNDWTLQIDDDLHCNISTDAVEALVEGKLVATIICFASAYRSSDRTPHMEHDNAPTLSRQSG